MTDFENNIPMESQSGEPSAPVVTAPPPAALICGYCGAPVTPGAKFCPICGRPVNVVETKKFCSCCGAELQPNEMFCRHCGTPTAERRDAEVMNSIAAYNSSVGKPKKKEIVPLRIKEKSFWSFSAWMLLAAMAAFVSCYLTRQFSYAKYYDQIFNASTLLMLCGGLLLLVASITGILCWKEDKKLRFIPIICSFIGMVCSSVWIYGYWNIAGSAVFLIPHVVAFLAAIRVIKTKPVLLSTAIPAALITAFMYFSGRISFFDNLKGMLFRFILIAPMLLLCCSFTTKEPAETPKKKGIWRKMLALVLAIAILLGGVGVGLAISWVRVSDVTGKYLDTAEQQFKRLSVSTVFVYDDNVEKMVVISQEPKGGSFAHPYSIVTLTISKGKGVKIPDLTNVPLADAKKTLTDLGLKVDTIYDYSSTVGKDKVIRLSSHHVDEGATVTVTVSKGPDTRVSVPSVVGQTESDARKNLQKAGFQVAVQYVLQNCDAYRSTAYVTAQSLTGKHEKGSSVVLQVAKPSISISKVHFEHNSVAGVDIDITFKNLSNKSIKYVVFKTRFKNAVGDDVYCEIRSDSTRNLQFTGPLSAGATKTAYWDAVIYNWNCKQIHFDAIEVTFMDGTTHTMTYNGYWYH